MVACRCERAFFHESRGIRLACATREEDAEVVAQITRHPTLCDRLEHPSRNIGWPATSARSIRHASVLDRRGRHEETGTGPDATERA